MNRYRREDYYKNNININSRMEILPFVLESTGALGKKASDFLLKLAAYNNDLFDNDNINTISKSELVMHMRRLVSISLQVGNAFVFDEGIGLLYTNYFRLNSVQGLSDSASRELYIRDVAYADES